MDSTERDALISRIAILTGALTACRNYFDAQEVWDTDDTSIPDMRAIVGAAIIAARPARCPGCGAFHAGNCA